MALDAGERLTDCAFIASRGRFALWGKGRKHDKDAEGAKLLGVSPAEVGVR